MFRIAVLILLLLPFAGFSQWKDYRLINDGRDTINRIDTDNRKEGEWVIRVESLRGEPGYEEEGLFVKGRKEGEWRIYSLMGDLVGIENYRWGMKDGLAQYFSIHGNLRLEQNWVALNPDKPYDTLQVEDVDKLDSYRQVVVKNEGASIRHGIWKYYDISSGALLRSENYVLGKLEKDDASVSVEPAKIKAVPKPKEVQEFEKKNSGRKRIKYQDGSTY